MDDAKCHLLIQLYGAKNLLWNSKSPKYYNKSLRHDAWVDISKAMDLPIPELKKKMTTLSASYRREKSRIAKSIASGCATDEVYVSKSFGFDDFCFMQDKDVPNETLDMMHTNTQTAPHATQKENNETGPTVPSANEQGEEPPKDNYRASDNKKVKKKKKEEDSPMMKKAFEVLTECFSSTSDSYFSYGQHIANELRKYDSHTLTYVKQAINKVIFEADLGKYTNYRYSTQKYAQSCSDYNATPSPQAPMPSPQAPMPFPQAPTLRLLSMNY